MQASHSCNMDARVRLRFSGRTRGNCRSRGHALHIHGAPCFALSSLTESKCPTVRPGLIPTQTCRPRRIRRVKARRNQEFHRRRRHLRNCLTQCTELKDGKRLQMCFAPGSRYQVRLAPVCLQCYMTYDSTRSAQPARVEAGPQELR